MSDTFEQSLLRAIDASPFSQEEWRAALKTVEDYLQKHDLSADRLTILGYLQCCSEALRNLSELPRFEDHVGWMLESHGFARAEKFDS